MKPLLSILIPAYNAEKWISDTLWSVINQTWPNKEIIVVDDGSTDGTAAIARGFDGVQVVTQPNQGPAAARNRAYSLSRGDYIQWLDADDLLSPDKISRQMEFAEHYNSARTLFTCAWGKFVYDPTRTKFVPSALWCDLSPVEFLLRKMEQYLFMLTSTWLVSRELAEVTGPWDTSLAVDDDGEYFCRILRYADSIRFVPEAVAYYRASGFNGVSYIGRSQAKLDAQWRSILINIRDFRSIEDSPRVRAACVTFIQTWLTYFYPERPDIVSQAQLAAQELGGRLHTPQLCWKYRWIQHLFGWETAKRTRTRLLNLKWSFLRLWESIVFSVNKRSLASSALTAPRQTESQSRQLAAFQRVRDKIARDALVRR